MWHAQRQNLYRDINARSSVPVPLASPKQNFAAITRYAIGRRIATSRVHVIPAKTASRYLRFSERERNRIASRFPPCSIRVPVTHRPINGRASRASKIILINLKYIYRITYAKSRRVLSPSRNVSRNVSPPSLSAVITRGRRGFVVVVVFVDDQSLIDSIQFLSRDVEAPPTEEFEMHAQRAPPPTSRPLFAHDSGARSSAPSYKEVLRAGYGEKSRSVVSFAA